MDVIPSPPGRAVLRRSDFSASSTPTSSYKSRFLGVTPPNSPFRLDESQDGLSSKRATNEAPSILFDGLRERSDTSSFTGLTTEERERKRRQSIHRDTIKRAFIIAIERIRKCLQITPITMDIKDQEVQADLKRDFRRAVRTLHNEVFTAAGYIPWLKRNFPPNKAKQEVATFRGLNNRPSRIVDTKFKDLLLRETIWTVAEQIRHCPQRINQLFHIFKHSTDNNTWYKKKVAPLFLYDNQEDIGRLQPPFIDIYTVHDGIDQFKNGELNFDDINDCGKWNEKELFKTFYEPPGTLLFFLILKYSSGMIQFKLWSVAFIFFL